VGKRIMTGEEVKQLIESLGLREGSSPKSRYSRASGPEKYSDCSGDT
jgi:hypothetical protein